MVFNINLIFLFLKVIHQVNLKLLTLFVVLKNLVSFFVATVINVVNRLFQYCLRIVVFILYAIAVLFWVQCVAIVCDKYFVATLLLQLMLLFLVLSPITCILYYIITQLFFDIGSLKQYVICGFVVYYVTNKWFNLCVMLFVYVMMRMLIWSALGVFETGVMYFGGSGSSGGVDGNSGSDAGGFNGSSGTNNQGGLPLIGQSVDDSEHKSSEKKECCFGEQSIAIKLKNSTIDISTSSIPTSVDFLSYKLVNVSDRYLYHSKIVAQPLSFTNVPAAIVSSIQNTRVLASNEYDDLEDLFYYDTLKNCDIILADPELSKSFGDSARKTRTQLFAGNYESIFKPFLKILNFSFENPAMSFLLSHSGLIKEGTFVVTDYNKMCPPKEMLHAHPAIQSNAVIYDSDSDEYVLLKHYQIYSSSSYGGENIKLPMSTNISGQNKAQFAAPVIFTASSSTQDSSVVLVDNRALGRFILAPQNKQILCDAFKFSISRAVHPGNDKALELLAKAAPKVVKK